MQQFKTITFNSIRNNFKKIEKKITCSTKNNFMELPHAFDKR